MTEPRKDGQQSESAPPSLTSYPAVIDRWGDLMLHELEANHHKDGWLGMHPEALMTEVWWHAAKLALAVRDGDVAAVREYAADTANLAMMTADTVAASGSNVASGSGGGSQ